MSKSKASAVVKAIKAEPAIPHCHISAINKPFEISQLPFYKFLKTLQNSEEWNLNKGVIIIQQLMAPMRAFRAWTRKAIKMNGTACQFQWAGCGNSKLSKLRWLLMEPHNSKLSAHFGEYSRKSADTILFLLLFNNAWKRIDSFLPSVHYLSAQGYHWSSVNLCCRIEYVFSKCLNISLLLLWHSRRRRTYIAPVKRYRVSGLNPQAKLLRISQQGFYKDIEFGRWVEPHTAESSLSPHPLSTASTILYVPLPLYAKHW